MQKIELAEVEIQDAAQAARIAAVQAEQDASNQSNPSVRGIFEKSARRFRQLAAKFDQARKSSDSR